MKHPKFQPGETAVICYAPDFPSWVGSECKIISGLRHRANYDKFGNFRGESEAYLIEVDGREVCAPERCLDKLWERGWWRDCVWQPKREAR